MSTVEHTPQYFEAATRISELEAQLNIVATGLEDAARLPDGVDKYARFVDLHDRESRCWKRAFELTPENMALVYGARLRAAEWAADKSRGWQARLIAVLRDAAPLTATEQVAA